MKIEMLLFLTTNMAAVTSRANQQLQEHRQAVRVTAVFIITTEKFRRSIFVFLCDEIVWYQRASSRIQQIFYVKYLVFHVLMQFISYRGCLHFLC